MGSLTPRGLVKFTETHKEGSRQKQGQGLTQNLSALLLLKRTQPEICTLIFRLSLPEPEHLLSRTQETQKMNTLESSPL